MILSKFKINSHRYRKEIDGLRAFAVICVIVNHFNQNLLPGGYFGVDIFFVISGYVITSSAYYRESYKFWEFFGNFFARRIRRLVPALSVFVLVVSLFVCIVSPSPGTSLSTGFSSLFGVSNLYLLTQSTDYFAQESELNVFMHTWSLGVEEQFYILFPFLLWFSGFSQKKLSSTRNLCMIVGILSTASLVLFIFLYSANQSAAYFLMPARFWEMGGGCIAFIGLERSNNIKDKIERISPSFLIGLIACTMFFPSYLAVSSTIIIFVASILLIASLREKTFAFKIFTNDIIVYVGLISYSLYLWHWSVLSLSRLTIGIHWWSVPFQILLILGLAVSSYQWIESPFRTREWFHEKWKIILLGFGIIFSSSFVCILLSKTKVLFIGEECRPFQDHICVPDDHPHLSTTPFIAGTSIQRSECFRYEGGVLTSSIIENCTISPRTENAPTIYLVGSSYTHHKLPFFAFLRDRYGVGISMLVKGGCDFDPLMISGTKQCRETNSNRLDYLSQNVSSGDIIYTGTSSIEVDQSQVNAVSEFARINRVNTIYYSPIPAWKRLEGSVQAICMNPQWYQPNITRICNKYTTFSRAKFERQAKESIDFLHLVESKNPFFNSLILHEMLCEEDFCPSHHKDGVRIYRDNFGHISLPFAKGPLSRSMYDYFIEKEYLDSQYLL